MLNLSPEEKSLYFFIHNFIIDLLFSLALCLAAWRSRVWFSTFLCQQMDFRVSEATQVWLICYFTLTRCEYEDVPIVLYETLTMLPVYIYTY